jgi:hypothetical protein
MHDTDLPRQHDATSTWPGGIGCAITWFSL